MFSVGGWRGIWFMCLAAFVLSGCRVGRLCFDCVYLPLLVVVGCLICFVIGGLLVNSVDSVVSFSVFWDFVFGCLLCDLIEV